VTTKPSVVFRATRITFLAAALATAAFDPSLAQKGGGKGGANVDRVLGYFKDYDQNGDGRISEEEWKRRGNFERLDANKNGSIELTEFRVIFGSWGRKGPMTAPILPSATPEMDPSAEADLVGTEVVGPKAVCAVSRSTKCTDGNAAGRMHGLFETGLGPVFPRNAHCHGIDEYYAAPYADKTGKGNHGGIDLPTDYGTSMLAAAAGTVVGKFTAETSARGMVIVLRHSPRDTGLPMWVYTEYGHLDAMPRQAVGQRVRMGDVLGPTGNSGLNPGGGGPTMRRPGIHFAVYFSDSPRFAITPAYIVPEDVAWMDPSALYRKAPPYDSLSMKALPESEKSIPVPIMFLDGVTEPADTKLIWPYACARD
jgi:murein DD-endopeptidase MepM/ murein hydrolase activator NlpD